MNGVEVKIRATKDQISEFAESFLWKDIKRELGMWKKGLEKEMIEVVEATATSPITTASLLTRLGSIQGRIMAIDYVLALPITFLQMKEEEDAERIITH